jgi:membrane protease YdiL (CAAX protease family)
MIERLKQQPPFLQVIAIISIGIVSYFVFSMVLFTVLPFFVSDATMRDITIMEHENGALYMLLLYIPMQICLFLIPGLIYRRITPKSELPFPTITEVERKQWLIWGIGLFSLLFLLLPALNELNVYFTKLTGTYDNLLENKLLSDERLFRLFGPDTPKVNLFVALIVIAGVTAICEEFAFRRFLLAHILKTTGHPWLSILTSGIFFAILHFNYLQIFPLLGYGIGLGLIYYTTQSIWPGIILHAIINAISINWVHHDTFPEWMQTHSYQLTIPTLVITSGLIFWKRKKLIFRE